MSSWSCQRKNSGDNIQKRSSRVYYKQAKAKERALQTKLRVGSSTKQSRDLNSHSVRGFITGADSCNGVGYYDKGRISLKRAD
jgi:hypothetical protein